MVHTTVLVPQRNAGAELATRIPRLCQKLATIGRPFEVIVIDDASAPSSNQHLVRMIPDHAALRLIRMDRPCGTSAALTAGIAASRGEVIVAFDAAGRYPVDQIQPFIQQLSRADMVCGRIRHQAWRKIWHRVSRIPRWLILGLEVRDPACLFWSARREAVEGLELARGMFRYLPYLVALRGYRVSELSVDPPLIPAVSSDGLPNPFDLLLTWWLQRRSTDARAHEMQATKLPVHGLPLIEHAQQFPLGPIVVDAVADNNIADNNITDGDIQRKSA